jgi:hypothetical protein
MEVGEMHLQLCRIGSSHNGVGGLGKTKTAEYMMFQHVSNILPSFTLQESKKGFPFEALLSATKVYSHFWDFKSTGYFHKILLQCYLELSRVYQSIWAIRVNSTFQMVFCFVTPCRIFG